jgi:anti-sigma factor RsiW
MMHDHPSTEILIDYVHGELPAHDDAAIHEHVTACAQCSEARDVELRLSEVLREQARSEERELPPGFAARVVAAATSDRPQPAWWHSLQGALRPTFALPAAAAVALVAYVGFSMLHGNVKTTTVDAAYYIENHAALATDMPFGEGSTLPIRFVSNDTTVEQQRNDGP